MRRPPTSPSRGRLGFESKTLLDRADQALDVNVEVAPRLHINGVEVGKVLDAVRQVLRIRHLCVVEQHGEDVDVALERRLKLDPHRIGCVHDSRVVAAARSQPFLANDGDQEVARLRGIVDMFAKIDAIGNVVDVNEETRLAEAPLEAVEDAPRHGGIGASI